MSDLTLNIALDFFKGEKRININVHVLCNGEIRELIKQHEVKAAEISNGDMFEYLENIIGKEIIKYPEYKIIGS